MSRPTDPELPPEFLRSPLLVLAGCFALGIFLARPGHLKALSAPLVFGSAGVILLIGLIALRLRFEAVSFLLALAGFVGAGATTARLFEMRFPPNHASRLAELGVDLLDPVRLEGRVVSSPLRFPYGLQFDVEVRRLESRGKVHLLAGKVRLRLEAGDDPETLSVADSLRLQYGDAIRALVRLRKPRIFRNPGSFNFRRWMESIEDITWVGTIKSPYLVEKLPGEDSFKVSSLLEKTRRRLLQGIDRLYPPWSADGRDGAALKAILLGDRSSLDSETIENFRKTGLYHLLVIAGLHVGLLATLAGFLLRLARVREAWRSAALFVFLLGYASLVEQRAPTLRATIMICAYVIARFLYREHAALNAIGLAALVLLLHRPPWLLETGFELSFSAALLIAGLAVPVLERTTEPYRRALEHLAEEGLDANFAPRQAQFRLDARSLIAWLEARLPYLERHPAVAASVVTGPAKIALWTANIFLFSSILQLGLLLPMAVTFHRMSIAGIGLNALAIPVMTVLLGLAVPTVILGAVLPALAAPLAKFLALILNCLFALTDLPNLPSWLSFRVPDPPAWVSWGFALSALIAAWALGRRGRIFRASFGSLVIFAALIALHPFRPRLPRGTLEVTALDCGGGDALFLVLPDQTTLLVDAGGTRARSAREGAFQGRRWDPGEDVVSPYLWSRGLEKIDIVVLTHAHQDHLGGLAAVLRNFRVGEFWRGANPPTPAYRALLEQVPARGIPSRVVAEGDRFTRGSTAVQILWPRTSASDRSGRRAPSNDDSVVMRISNGQAAVLLTGDISDKVERELGESNVSLESPVLKVAHHGSGSSSSPEFLARVSPRVALVSVEGGSLNLPNPEMLERLHTAGARVFRTDLDGAVTVELRGGALVVRSYRTSAAEGTTGPATFSVP